MDMPADDRGPDAQSQTRARSDSLTRRLRDWLTPARSRHGTDPATQLLPGTQLDVFRIDASTRQLLDPACCRYAFQVLRERGFPNRELSVDAADLQLLPDGSGLTLSALASIRWLAAADRAITSAAFGFLYQPFTLSVGGDCLISGRIVPAASRAALPCAILQPGIALQRVQLRGREAAIVGEEPTLAEVLRSLRKL